MKNFINIIKYDYLQRTRTYPFLITLCVSLAIAYTFVPEPNANYSTIRIANYVGFYNSAWFGYVTAMMASMFVSLIGFFLINSGIKKDITSKVGQIIASTKVTNFKYLISKTISNFLVLFTIVFIIFLMSIVLFFLYNDRYSFNLLQFLKPYAIITIPAIFFVAVIAVVFEVFLGRYSVLQTLAFFFLFSRLMIATPETEFDFSMDILGNKTVLHQMETKVKELKNLPVDTKTTVGFLLGNVKKADKFEFNGAEFSNLFIASRFLWIVFGIVLIGITSLFFHRFNLKERVTTKKKSEIVSNEFQSDILLSLLPKATTNFGIFPLIKTELLLLFRKGKRWMWLVNIIVMVLLVVLPLKSAHQIVLPILWFLQVSRLSELTTKEMSNNVHYFAFSSFNPLQRLLRSQLISGCILMTGLSFPLVIRYIVIGNSSLVLAIILGAIFIVLLASVLGIVSKGKKLFEVFFFMLTYANINGIQFVDYFGGFNSNLLKITLIISTLAIVTFFRRNHELTKQ